MLSGDLAEFPFPSLVGALMSAGRTGRLHLRPPFLEAEVYLRGGQVVHAKAQAGERALEGEEALDRLVGLRRAPFVFEPEALPPHTTLLGGLEVPARLAQAQAAWEKVKLPADLQAIVRTASRAANQDMLDEYTARNNAALQSLVEEDGVQLRRLPDDVLLALWQGTQVAMKRLVDSDPMAAKVYESYRKFYKGVRNYHHISEQSYINARDKAIGDGEF